MNRHQRMIDLLSVELSPSHLLLLDESEQHRGHRGWQEGGQTHFRLEIESQKLKNLSKVAANQLIYKLLKPEFESGLHAISIKVIY